MDLFAGIRVADFETAKEWYERLLGSPPSFFPHDTEAVWTLAEHRHVYIVEDRDAAGGAVVTLSSTTWRKPSPTSGTGASNRRARDATRTA